KLLGEKLVGCRLSDGTAAIFDPRCPHRGADLFFGRNEENGLRCVYHGWKFAASTCRASPHFPIGNRISKTRCAPPPTHAKSAAASSGRIWGRPSASR